MEFVLGYLAGANANWQTTTVTLLIVVGIIVLVKVITGRDIS